MVDNDNGLLIADEDDDNDDTDTGRLLDRFVLAILYYSTKGDNWNTNDGWLSNDSVCSSWYMDDNFPPCPKVDGRVNRIDLGK